jgi:hypothetical protein
LNYSHHHPRLDIETFEDRWSVTVSTQLPIQLS